MLQPAAHILEHAFEAVTRDLAHAVGTPIGEARVEVRRALNLLDDYAVYAGRFASTSRPPAWRTRCPSAGPTPWATAQRSAGGARWQTQGAAMIKDVTKTIDDPSRSPDGDALRALLERFPVPRWAPVCLSHDAAQLDDVAAAVAEQFSRPGIGERIHPGARVALTAGSRGVDRIGDVLAATVAEVQRRGGQPFIVPAMGSHGGAVAEGQVAVLAHYGITEHRMGCPIRASMEVVELGQVPSGERIFTDRIAYTEADLVIPVNRIKPHTDFHGTVESGLFKMLAIGLGKQRGADALHARGFEHFPWLIPAAGRFVLEHLPIPFGIATVENGYSQLALLEAIPSAMIATREPELLEEARRRMARLPVAQLDVLVIDHMGKEISGAGMDPNVLGRYYQQRLPGGPDVQRIIVLDLTNATAGNAAGVGLADICTERVATKLDRMKTYINQLTAKTPEGGRLPLVARSDRAAIQMAIASLRRATYEALRLLRIRNTKDLTQVWASEVTRSDLLASGRAEPRGELAPPAFDADGNLW
jgi:hypothetical protein